MPATHVEMTVLALMPTPKGAAVLLADREGEVALPIFIGGTEALSIALRHEDRRYARPLTHDLLDAIMSRLGGELVKVHIDDVQNGVFIGTVFVRQGERLISVDARPSDAIALAVGDGVPIFVARRVLATAGIRREDLERDDKKMPPLPAGGVEQL